MENKNIILYTIHCEHCEILEKKLMEKNIKFAINENIEVMREKHFKTAPMLEVDGKLYNYSQAMLWVSEYK